MADMMKKMSKGKGGMAGAMASLMGGKMPGGMGGMPDPSQMDPAQLERMAREMGIDPAALPAPDAAPQKELPKDVNQLIKSGGTTPSLPGLGAPRFPGLPGLGGMPGKKK